jgi:hypothetical protein
MGQSLAYEIAPFNIKLTILQPNIEVSILGSKISAAPALPQYSPSEHPAPLARKIVSGILDHVSPADFSAGSLAGPGPPSSLLSSPTSIASLCPVLPAEARDHLLAETVHALTAIGGHDNPPARHMVGFEAVGSVKEKLKTVSEELEDFVEVSMAVDIDAP